MYISKPLVVASPLRTLNLNAASLRRNSSVKKTVKMTLRTSRKLV